MSTSVKEAQSFHNYVLDRIQNGASMLDLDDLLMEWRHLTSENPNFAEDVQAIKAALRDLEAGERGIPAEDVLQSLKAQYPLPETR